ncbi:MAG: hypothetical protein JNK19_12990 [Tabrizicola sp.]|nr:hypothetical protein [Tabrizicola sp.]
MADTDGELTVAQRLGRALDRGLLPAGGPAEAAERLIERLERPARVALLGLPGAGKSSILNLLVGAVVVPETLRLPTIIVQHGPEARMICTLTDGTSRIVPGGDLAEVLPLAPALVTLELDLPALKVISLLEVSAGPMEAEQRRAATWASKRADIVVWCTTSYLPKEQSVWESLPDSVKDNSFMFLTKVDLLGSRESATAMHDRVELRAGEEFRQILSISARQARAAMPAGGPVNRDLFRDSGASAVITAIKTRVQSGRRADMDTAELLLARHVEASEFVARRFAESDEAAPSPVWTPPPEVPAEAATPPESGDAEAVAEVPDVVSEEVEPEAEDEPEAQSAAEFAEEQQEAEDQDFTAEEPAGTDEPVLSTDSADDVGAVEEDDTPEVPVEPVAEEPESGTRRRFADRIKRVASSPDTASTPLVPLRSTWKSKAEMEAPPEPEPEPERPPEPIRRPRPAAPVAQDDGDVARMLASVVSSPDKTDPPQEPAPSAAPVPPAPSAEPPRAARPQLFGGRRPAAGQGESDRALPDLSSLRARPEDEEPREDIFPEEPEAYDIDADETDFEPAPETVAEHLPEPEPEAVEPEPAPEGPGPDTERRAAALSEPADQPRVIERPRLFDRQARVRPAETTARPRAEIRPMAAPETRLPAPPRMPAPQVEPRERPTTVRPEAVEHQFSPRAIMSRERPPAVDGAAPRRERPRIAARAVSAPLPTTEIPAVETEIVSEAINVIVARSAELQAEIDPDAKVPVDMILEHSRETTEQVMEIVTRGRSEELRRIKGDLGEVLDLIMLMQLEKGHAPADDALTLILQLRRELETLRAA